MDQIKIANKLSHFATTAAQIETTWDDVSFGDQPSRKEKLSQLGKDLYDLQMRLFSGELYHSDAPALIETLDSYQSKIETWDSRASGRSQIEDCRVILGHWARLIRKQVSDRGIRSNFPERDDWLSF